MNRVERGDERRRGWGGGEGSEGSDARDGAEALGTASGGDPRTQRERHRWEQALRGITRVQ